ncbi:hypothetical protein [Thiocapsa rosea]|uniref:Uncharacterized protein n=1 Tax=Thiocapsa rosea TaxID=69360 RepID=A0A495VAW9_9GAMM|nr:hypothetical protein [Thiocapsa rosea]RKT46489.1 hypothetical protein BDD21_4002 [Thiocapsa rosea]
MQTLEHCRVDARIEAVCSKGCSQVRQDIAALEAGAQLPETRDLSEEERGTLLRELKQIMAVYGDACRLPST